MAVTLEAKVLIGDSFDFEKFVMDKAAIKNWAVEFSYNGFVPEVTAQALIAIKDKIAAAFNGMQLKAFIAMICTFYATRGALFSVDSKVYTKSKEEVQQKISKLINLGFKTGPASKLAVNDLNIARVAAAFPIITAHIMGAVGRDPVGDNIDLGKLPKGFRFQAGASIIPLKNVEMFDTFVAWSKAYNRIIKSSTSDKDTETYAKLSHESKLIPDVNRDYHVQNIAKIVPVALG
jgi:hypothetical protein